MKMHFDELFAKQNGNITPKVNVQMNGVSLKSGVSIGEEAVYGGIDFKPFIGKYFEVEFRNNIYSIKGVFEK